MGDHEGTLQLEFGDINRKTKLILKRFGGTFGTSGFNEKSFNNNLSGVTQNWDC